MSDPQTYGPRFRYDPDAPTNIEMHDFCVRKRHEVVWDWLTKLERYLKELCCE